MTNHPMLRAIVEMPESKISPMLDLLIQSNLEVNPATLYEYFVVEEPTQPAPIPAVCNDQIASYWK